MTSSHFPSVGNTTLRNRIFASARKGTLPHAILFVGPAGIGKFTFAKELAMILLQDTDLILKNTHPSCRVLDNLWIEGIQEDMDILSKSSNIDQSHRKKERKKTDTIGIDDLQVLTQFLFETSDDPWKVCIIRNIDRFGREASHSFLKVLEEPPPKTIFLLTTPHLSRLPLTILSRVQIEKMNLVPNRFLRPFLQEHKIPTPEEQDLYLSLAGGRPEVLQRLLEDPEFLESQTLLKEELFQILPPKSTGECFERGEIWGPLLLSEGKERLEILQGIWRNHLRKELFTSQTKGKALFILEAIHSLQKTLQTNANRKLAFENFFLSLSPQNKKEK